MTRIVFGIATAVVLCFTSCAKKAVGLNPEDDRQYMCGAYAEYHALTDEDARVFGTAYKYGAKLTPRSVATQVVAGTNYKYICTDASASAVEVVVFQPLPNRGEARVVSAEAVSGKETPEVVALVAQIMYDDVLSVYNSGENSTKNAFRKYASASLNNLLDEVDEAISGGKIEPMVYGWDCDPWIMAQDWSHATAKVVAVRDLSDKRCMVDVEIRAFGQESTPTNVTLALVKEGKQWKVDDFVASDSGQNTFVQALKADFGAAKH